MRSTLPSSQSWLAERRGSPEPWVSALIARPRRTEVVGALLALIEFPPEIISVSWFSGLASGVPVASGAY